MVLKDLVLACFISIFDLLVVVVDVDVAAEEEEEGDEEPTWE
jgi:hypothetical protein